MPPFGDLCSVIITSYNYGRYLENAIESVLSQDDGNLEIIVVDDGSLDDTAAVAGRYGSRIHYFRQDHAGPFAAAQAGVFKARGSRIVFVDADDRLRPQALRHLRATAGQHPDAALVLGRICYTNEAGDRTVFEPPLLLGTPLENFRQFCRGRLKPVIAGGLIDKNLLLAFSCRDLPKSMDLAIIGLGFLRGCVQSDFCTIDVVDHPGRARDDVNYVDRSGLRLVDVLFDDQILPPQALAFKRSFTSFRERERARSYYRAGWHSSSWRSYVRSVRAHPQALLDRRSLRRFAVSLALDAMRRDEGPVKRPPSHWLLGHQRPFFSDPIGFTAKAFEGCRTNVRIDLQRRTYLLAETGDIRHVLSRNATNYQPNGISRNAPAFADGLLGALHPGHKPMRQWLAHYLDPRETDGYRGVISDRLDGRFAALTPNTTFDVAPIVRSVHFDIASRIVLGCEAPEQIEVLDRLIVKSHNYASRIVRSPIRLPRWVPLRPQRVIKAVESEIDALFAEIVGSKGAENPPSILKRMLDDRNADGGRPVQEIRDNTIGLMLAACEPVTIPTYLSIFLLGKHPALQERIVDELRAFSGTLQAEGADQFDYKKLVFLNRFIDEILRIYPSEWLLTRKARRSERLPSGLLVRRGNQIMVSIYNLHRDSARFPRPELIDPDRFAVAGAKASGEYMPFGTGAMACLGQPLSRLIIVMSLVNFLSKWQVEDSQGEIRLSSPNCFSILPAWPISVRLQKRDPFSPT